MARLLLLIPTATYRAGAFVRAAQKLDIDITIASERPNSLAEYLPDDLITLNFSHPSACAKRIVSFARRHPIDAVVGVDDQVARAASAIGEALSLPHNPAAATRAALNKYDMRRRLSDAGVPIPHFQRIRADLDPRPFADAQHYPCVLKPLAMFASRGVIRADDPPQFVQAFEKIRGILEEGHPSNDPRARHHVLVESYVPGWEVAVEGILSEGRLHVFAIFDKPDPLEGPYFPETIYVAPSRLPSDVLQRIAVVTQEATRALGLAHGPIHAELRGTDQDLWFIEVAARSIGGYCSKVLRFKGGVSLEDVIIAHALDPRAAIAEREPEACGVFMMQAPKRGVFHAVHGMGVACAVPGVEEILVSAYPGQELTPLPEGFLYLGFIFARASSPDAVESALRAAHETLRFDIT
jgi:biotin carboxylase